MRKLLAILFLLPALAWGDTLNAGNGTVSVSGPVGAGYSVCSSDNGRAWQGTNPGTISFFGSASCTGTGCGTNVTRSITVSEYTPGNASVQILCSYTTAGTGSLNGSCPSPAVTAGNHAFIQACLTFNNGLTSAQGGSAVDSGSTSSNAMFWCATNGAACTCNGICNGAGCGHQYSAADSTVCQCDCTYCSSLSIGGPSPFSCSDQHDATHTSCTWGTVTGASAYSLNRGATTAYSGSGTSAIDAPGPGTWSYTVNASGTCTPAIGGTSYSKITNNSSTSVTVVPPGAIIGCW